MRLQNGENMGDIDSSAFRFQHNPYLGHSAGDYTGPNGTPMGTYGSYADLVDGMQWDANQRAQDQQRQFLRYRPFTPGGNTTLSVGTVRGAPPGVTPISAIAPPPTTGPRFIFSMGAHPVQDGYYSPQAAPQQQPSATTNVAQHPIAAIPRLPGESDAHYNQRVSDPTGYANRLMTRFNPASQPTYNTPGWYWTKDARGNPLYTKQPTAPVNTPDAQPQYDDAGQTAYE